LGLSNYCFVVAKMDKDGDEPAPPKGDADPKGIPPVGEPNIPPEELFANGDPDLVIVTLAGAGPGELALDTKSI
jgi:hypothetical protein